MEGKNFFRIRYIASLFRRKSFKLFCVEKFKIQDRKGRENVI